MSVQRYDFHCSGVHAPMASVFREDEGDYVLFSDYATLEAENARLHELAHCGIDADGHPMEWRIMADHHRIGEDQLRIKVAALEARCAGLESREKKALDRFAFLVARRDGEPPESLEEVADILLRRVRKMAEENMALRSERDAAVARADATTDEVKP